MVAIAVGAYAWWATGLRPFTTPSLLAVVLAGVVTIAAGRRWRRPTVVTPDEGRLAGWAVLALTLAVWELAAFLQHPRADHPTLSSLADALLDTHAARAAAFVVWVAAGLVLARR